LKPWLQRLISVHHLGRAVSERPQRVRFFEGGEKQERPSWPAFEHTMRLQIVLGPTIRRLAIKKGPPSSADLIVHNPEGLQVFNKFPEPLQTDQATKTNNQQLEDWRILGSLLMATMILLSLHTAKCWIAPEIPIANIQVGRATNFARFWPLTSHSERNPESKLRRAMPYSGTQFVRQFFRIKAKSSSGRRPPRPPETTTPAM